jgi:hypothetical protein
MLVPLTHRLGRAKTGKTVHFQLTPLQPGTRLTELEVAAVLGMSRTAVAGRLAVAVSHASVNFPVRHELRVRALTA